MAHWAKNPPAMQEMHADVSLIPWSGRSPGGGHGRPLQFLPGEPHGEKSLVGYSLWGGKESDMTEKPVYKHVYIVMYCLQCLAPQTVP